MIVYGMQLPQVLESEIGLMSNDRLVVDILSQQRHQVDDIALSYIEDWSAGSRHFDNIGYLNIHVATSLLHILHIDLTSYFAEITNVYS